jgi:hypothetical protein
VRGTTNVVIELGDDDGCIEFSGDWKRMLHVNNSGVTIYDFDAILKSGSLSGNEIGTIALKDADSAFFVDAAGGAIVATNGTERVFLWKPVGEEKTWTGTELYNGDNPILFAEPDSSGERLILLEGVGEGEVHGFMYSIPARQVWFDLGEDYKWLGAAFTEKSEIVVSKHGTWTDIFPMLPLSTLAALADKELSPECRPAASKEYRESPCWPANYR